MKKLYTFIIALTCAVSSLSAATPLPNNVQVKLPPELQTMLVQQSVVDKVGKEKPVYPVTDNKGKYWVVYSDRAENTTYNGPSKSAGEYGKVGFRDKLTIAKIENGYAMVYTDVDGASFPEITRMAEYKGWIPMDNLLLWPLCPVDKRGIYNKALVILDSNAEGVKSGNSSFKNKQNKVYYRPEEYKLSEAAYAGQIYYILKTEGKYSLLGTTHNVGVAKGEKNDKIYGWIERTAYTPWNQRACLERIWKETKIKTLVGSDVNIYPNANLSGGAIRVYTYKPEDNKRNLGEFLRNPILDEQSGSANIYNIKAFTQNLSADEMETRNIEHEKWLAKKKTVNLIFVIDGTDSMKDYYPSVINAIDNCTKVFTDGFRVGAVIYRDVKDGEFVTEYTPMADYVNPNWRNFLKTGGKYGIKSSPTDKTSQEDMLSGLELALDMSTMGYSSDNSNIMILLGDCGHDHNEYMSKYESIVKKMVDARIQFLVFQTQYTTNQLDACEDFVFQTNQIMRGNIEGQFKNYYGGWKTGQIVPVKGGYDFKYDESKSESTDEFVTCAFRDTNGPGKFDLDELTKVTTENIYKCQTKIQNLLNLANDPNALNSPYSGSGFKISNASEKEVDVYVRTLGWSKELAELWKKGQTISYEGFTPIRNESNADQWAQVIFISEEELADMLKQMENAYNMARVSTRNDRSPFIDALAAIVKATIGGVDVKETSMKTITAYLGGLNVKSDALSKIDEDYSLEALSDPRIVSDDKFKSILDKYKKKYENLINIQRKYDFTYDVNGNKYFWIPVEDIP